MAYYILKSYSFNGDSFSLFQKLKNQDYPFFLDSSLNSCSLGRFSFLGCNPFYILKTKNKDPTGELRELLIRYRIPSLNQVSPFLCGAVGYLGYDLGFLFEKKLSKKVNDDLFVPDCFFGFYDTVIIYDHFKKVLSLFSSGFPETRYALAKLRAQARFKEMLRLISETPLKQSKGLTSGKPAAAISLESNFRKERYIAAIKKAKEYIRRGDIYQVNLAQRFTADTLFSAEEIYRRLRNLSPSFFSAYLDCGEFQMISSSPERFLNLKNGYITTRPMKGTRGRSENKFQDANFKKQLLNSAKDKAELMMIVDLERNDLGRVCNYGSVKIESLRTLERYKTVFQTTATISGLLHKDKDQLDLIKACFPGGSITGCPKIRAMEIIEELEPHRRAVYTGSFGYLGFNGNLDLSILIRTILKKGKRIYFHAGGGIVADSNPEDEYAETLVKARAMIEAIS